MGKVKVKAPTSTFFATLSAGKFAQLNVECQDLYTWKRAGEKSEEIARLFNEKYDKTLKASSINSRLQKIKKTVAQLHEEDREEQMARSDQSASQDSEKTSDDEDDLLSRKKKRSSPSDEESDDDVPLRHGKRKTPSYDESDRTAPRKAAKTSPDQSAGQSPKRQQYFFATSLSPSPDRDPASHLNPFDPKSHLGATDRSRLKRGPLSDNDDEIKSPRKLGKTTRAQDFGTSKEPVSQEANPEAMALRDDVSEPNSPGWKLRDDVDRVTMVVMSPNTTATAIQNPVVPEMIDYDYWNDKQRQWYVDERYSISPAVMEKVLAATDCEWSRILNSDVFREPNMEEEEQAIRVVRQLAFVSPDIVELLTGSRDSGRLETATKPESGEGSSGLFCHLMRAVFWGVLYLRVLGKDILCEFNFPGAYEPGSTVHRDMLRLYDMLDRNGPTNSIKARYYWRKMRYMALHEPEFDAQVKKRAEECLSEIEDVICGWFRVERRTFPTQEREKLLGLFYDTIVIKCRGDLSCRKALWGWPKSGSFYDENVLNVKWYDVPDTVPLDDRMPHRGLNRVRFCYGPYLICRVPATGDAEFSGMEPWERDLRHARKPKAEQVGDGWQRDDATYRSKVLLLDGHPDRAGPEWVDR